MVNGLIVKDPQPSLSVRQSFAHLLNPLMLKMTGKILPQWAQKEKRPKVPASQGAGCPCSSNLRAPGVWGCQASRSF
jgi:hypothetical protein